MTEPRFQRKIVCLCGSTKFKDVFETAVRNESLAGHIVLSVGFFLHADREHWTAPLDQDGKPYYTQVHLDRIKAEADALHKDKIYMAHEIFVLNPGGYIGESTRGEIDYAHSLGKSVRYLEPPAVGQLAS